MTQDKKPDAYEIQEVSVNPNQTVFNVWGLHYRFLRPARRVLIGGVTTEKAAQALIADDIKYPFTVRTTPYNTKGNVDSNHYMW